MKDRPRAILLGMAKGDNMNKQEIFTKVKKHLLKQNKRATSATGQCLYRTPEGLRCAAGCLIPKKLYDPDIEGKSFDCDSIRNLRAKLGVTSPSCVSLVRDLQGIHDCSKPEYWPMELAALAKKRKLKS